MPRGNASAPKPANQGPKHRPVAIANLARRRRLRASHQLVSRRQNRHAGSRQQRKPSFGQLQPADQLDRPQELPGCSTVRPRASEAARRMMFWPGFAPACTMRTRSPAISVCSTMTTASAPAGIGAPVMIRVAVPCSTVRVGTAPAVISSRTQVRVWRGNVSRDHGIAIDDRLVMRRRIDVADDGLGQHPATSIDDWRNYRLPAIGHAEERAAGPDRRLTWAASKYQVLST